MLLLEDGVRSGSGAALMAVNMENFITGFSGHEFQLRAELRRRLGEEKCEYFFDKASAHKLTATRGRRTRRL